MGRLYDKVSEYQNLLSGWNPAREDYGCAGADRVTIKVGNRDLAKKGWRPCSFSYHYKGIDINKDSHEK